MNKVAERAKKESAAKFHYSSKLMYTEAKMIKLTLYLLSMIPIILSFIPAVNEIPNLTFSVTMGVFLLNIISELGSSLINNHKEKAVLLSQLYEAEITGSSFSKIEYDRELTNELNELAIRKAMGKIARLNNKFYSPDVPENINDEYTYLYLCRSNAATTKYLMSRMFYIYVILLIGIVTLFTSFALIKNDTKEFLQLIIQFYPLVLPIIRNINGCSKTMKCCSKIDADIDNFFADGDDSIERLARFQYYVQNIEFEMLMVAPARYTIFPFIFSHGMKILNKGVTKRFLEAIDELKKKALISKGVTIRTFRKDILTKKEIDLKTLEKKEQKLLEAQTSEPMPVAKIAPKPVVKVVAKPVAKTTTKAVAKPAEKKTTTTKTVKKTTTKK